MNTLSWGTLLGPGPAAAQHASRTLKVSACQVHDVQEGRVFCSPRLFPAETLMWKAFDQLEAGTLLHSSDNVSTMAGSTSWRDE